MDWSPAPEPAREIYIYPRVETSVITPMLAYILPVLTLLLGILVGIVVMKLEMERYL